MEILQYSKCFPRYFWTKVVFSRDFDKKSPTLTVAGFFRQTTELVLHVLFGTEVK